MTFDPTAHRVHWAEEKAEALRQAYGDLEGVDLLSVMITKEFQGRIAVSSSFGAEAAVLLDLVARVDPSVPVLVLDTGRLFPETYDYIRDLSRHLGLTDVRLQRPSDEEVMARDGDGELYRRDPDACCEMRKTKPLGDALRAFDAWVTGLRRDQWATRSNIRKVEIDHDHGAIVKLAPLADWTEDEVWDYIRANEVPYNALYDKGYKSIGCAPCTRPVGAGADPRSGRWWWETGAPKECGMHCAIETGGFEHELAALLGGHRPNGNGKH